MGTPIKPERLDPGDAIGIVSPASPPADPTIVDRGAGALEGLGFKVILAPNVRNRRGFLAGSDRERAADLMGMFADPRIKAMLCVRGGYGCARILPLLDYRFIRANPKILIGYSDITSLHCALLSQANLVTFHGPTLNAGFIKPNPAPFAWRSLVRTLMQPAVPGSICDGYNRKTISVVRRGSASGRLVGGNLSLICTTVGTPYQPSFKKKILFLEDIDEAPYRFDRMLTHLLNAGVLQQVAGIAVGLNNNCVDAKAKGSTEYRQTVDDVLKERLSPLKVPIVTGLPFGHAPLNATLPVGVRAKLDGVKGDLVITEPGVR
jgi:muramoyltetrapeptide carboxypeptidase